MIEMPNPPDPRLVVVELIDLSDAVGGCGSGGDSVVGEELEGAAESDRR